MKTRTQIEVVGAIIGLVWALLMPMYFGYDYSTQSFTVIAIAGVVTGILVALALSKPLSKSSPWFAMCLGLLALPFGVFGFGAISGIFSLIIGLVTGSDHATIGGALSLPFYQGWMYVHMTALVCSRWYLGFIVLPLAAAMSYLLRLAIVHGVSHDAA
jgi:hypothetical protein